jgi:uncharacterized membrane protein
VPTVLLIVGIVVVVLGIIVFLWPKPPPPDPGPLAEAEGPIGELAEVLKRLIELMDKFDQRARPGLLLIVVGLTLIGIGAWMESHDAKNAADAAGVLLLAPGLLRLRKL